MSATYHSNGQFFGLEFGNIFTENYEKNLRPVFYEQFTGEDVPFTLTNCATSADGLVGNGFAKAVYNNGTAIDYQKAVATFVHKSGASYGVGMGGTAAYITGTTLSIIRSGYSGTGTPTATDTESITFSLVAGETYGITLEKRACTMIASVTRLKTNETVSKTVTGVTTMCLGSPFVAVFTGTSVVCQGLAFFAPLFGRAKCLIVGDRITEGVSQEGQPDVRHAWKLMQDYFYGNCVISGVGWARTSGCKERVDKMLAMGYQFDTIMFFSGTNDGNDNYPATSYYQGIVDEYTAKGIRVIWGVPPMRVNYESSDKMPRVRTNILGVTGCSFIRFDWATQDANGDPDTTCLSDGTHLTATGYQRCYEFAVKELTALGV
jgi:hypothetical protein